MIDIKYKVLYSRRDQVFVVQTEINGQSNMKVVCQVGEPLCEDSVALGAIQEAIHDHVIRYIKENNPDSQIEILADDDNPIEQVTKMIQDAFERLDPDKESKN